MEDLSKDGEHVPEILSLTEQLYEKLKNAENQTLTREQVIAHLGEFRTHYCHVVRALVLIKKVTKKKGQKGGIELRRAPGLQLEILQSHREQLRQYFVEHPPNGGEGATDTTGGEKKTEVIRRKALEILERCPQGIRYSEWRRQIKAALPDANNNTIGGVIWDLDVKERASVRKQKGVFYPAKDGSTEGAIEEPSEEPEGGKPPMTKPTHKEHHFYQAFADWLKKLGECTIAEPIGGHILGKKWGTPDVMGVKEPPKGAIIQLMTEIVSAEMKIDTNSLITAFGQACAYRLFSHKSYIVVPENSPADDIERLDALSRIFGIGLITFNPQNPNDPKFSIRARAAKHDPEMSYVNRCMKLLVDAHKMWH